MYDWQQMGVKEQDGGGGEVGGGKEGGGATAALEVMFPVLVLVLSSAR